MDPVIVIGAMDRVRKFLMFQRAAFRSLLRRRRTTDADFVVPAGPPHPAKLCRCFGPDGGDPVHDVLADHDRGCPWVAAMCEACAGTGWCVRCGGDGIRPDWDPDKTAPQRPSALRVA